MVHCLKEGDQHAASCTAHTVKGAAAAIGANELSHVSAILETAIADRAEGLDRMFAAFKEKLLEALIAIEAFLAEERTGSNRTEGFE